MQKEIAYFDGEHAEGRPPAVLAQALRFLTSVQLGLKSRADVCDFASKQLGGRGAGGPGSAEKIAGAISVKSRTRVSGFGSSNFSASLFEYDNVRHSRFEIDTNVRMDSLGTETKPPEMEGTKPLPSRKASGQLAEPELKCASPPEQHRTQDRW